MCCSKPGEGAKLSYHKHLMKWTHFETDVYVNSQVEMPTPSELTYDASSPLLLISHYSHPMKWNIGPKVRHFHTLRKFKCLLVFKCFPDYHLYQNIVKKSCFQKSTEINIWNQLRSLNQITKLEQQSKKGNIEFKRKITW